MLVFRSEAHLDRWLAGRPRGAVVPLVQLAALASAWWGDRLAADWQPHTRDQNQAILERVGLTGPFWQLDAAQPPATGEIWRVELRDEDGDE